MSEKQELLKELEEKFEQVKKELKFKATLEQIDAIFFIRDFIQEQGYVSQHLSRQVCQRITALFNAWYGYMHGILSPNPQSILNMAEHQMFNEAEKREMMELMSKICALSSGNVLIGLTRDKAREGVFVDEALKLWEEVKPKLVKMMEKVSTNWKEKKPVKNEREEKDTFFG